MSKTSAKRQTVQGNKSVRSRQLLHEIATGAGAHAMTQGAAFPCHCEERSDAAILCRNYRVRTDLQSEIATTGAQPFAMKKRYGCGVPLFE